jgi:hypothetical protein
MLELDAPAGQVAQQRQPAQVIVGAVSSSTPVSNSSIVPLVSVTP